MEKFNILSDDKNKRLDLFLCERYEKNTRSHIKNMIESNVVLVNGKSVKAGYSLKIDDVVEVGDIELKELEILPQNLPLDIVYEDDDLVVVNKSKGVVVHPAVKNNDNTLVNALLYKIKNLSGINGVVRPGIVHRLDKDTTGLLVVAKNDFAHANLSKQIANKTCRRIYIALTEGNWAQDSGRIETFISRSSKNRLKMSVSDSGKLATTVYTVLNRYNKFNLMKFELKTGRTHQIRVHCEYMHHPVAGDKLYGSKSENLFKFGQLLHAQKLILTHPTTGEIMEFEAPLPKYFEDVLKNLK